MLSRRLYALPFLALLALIVVWPLSTVVVGSFKPGAPLEHYAYILGSRFYLKAFSVTLKLSLLTTALGLAIAVLLAIALRARSRRLSDLALTIGNIGANFAGVPSVLAFMILLGSNGIVTKLLREAGLMEGFDLYSWSGLVLTYLFFQVSIGTVLVLPVITAIPRDIEEAADLLGQGGARFWASVGLPVVWRQLLSVATLLFANAMGTYATAYTLMGTSAQIVTVRIGELVAGDVFADPGLANALSICLLVVLIAPILLAQLLTAKGTKA